MKQVLLTGIGGSIGVHFVAHIMHNTDWKIIGIDSFRHKGEFDRITEVCKDHPQWTKRIKVIKHDLSAPFSEREIKGMTGVDYILHLASLSDVQGSIDDPLPTIQNNVDSTLYTLELARTIWGLRGKDIKTPPGKVFLMFSTDEVYGPAKKDQAHKEWEPMLPSNPYAASKAAQEVIAISYWRSYGLPLIITNTMNNFGEMQQPNKWPVKIQKGLQRGETVTVHAAGDGQIGTRYYLHSRNTADAVMFILNKKKARLHRAGWIDRPLRYNIVGDKQISNLELAEIIAKLMGRELKYNVVDFHSHEPGHDVHYGLDGTKLEKLGWKSPVSFEESMKNTIEWQQQHAGWIDV